MTITELSNRYHIHHDTIYKAVRSGKLEATMKGKHPDIKVSEFLRWNEERTRPKRHNNKQCRGCIYSTVLDGSPACDYLQKTGHMRGCETYPRCEKRKVRREKN